MQFSQCIFKWILYSCWSALVGLDLSLPPPPSLRFSLSLLHSLTSSLQSCLLSFSYSPLIIQFYLHFYPCSSANVFLSGYSCCSVLDQVGLSSLHLSIILWKLAETVIMNLKNNLDITNCCKQNIVYNRHHYVSK